MNSGLSLNALKKAFHIVRMRSIRKYELKPQDMGWNPIAHFKYRERL